MTPAATFEWARAVYPSLRIVATINPEGKRVVLASLSHRGTEQRFASWNEEEMARDLTALIYRLNGWPQPGVTPSRNDIEAEIIATRMSNQEQARELGRELAMHNAQFGGYAGPVPQRPRQSDRVGRFPIVPPK